MELSTRPLVSIRSSAFVYMPAPYTTSTLQQDASRILNFSSSKTMKVAQSLYEGINIGKGSQTGLITYMRTDSTRLSDEACGAAQSYIISKFGKEYHLTIIIKLKAAYIDCI